MFKLSKLIALSCCSASCFAGSWVDIKNSTEHPLVLTTGGERLPPGSAFQDMYVGSQVSRMFVEDDLSYPSISIEDTHEVCDWASGSPHGWNLAVKADGELLGKVCATKYSIFDPNTHSNITFTQNGSDQISGTFVNTGWWHESSFSFNIHNKTSNHNVRKTVLYDDPGNHGVLCDPMGNCDKNFIKLSKDVNEFCYVGWGLKAQIYKIKDLNEAAWIEQSFIGEYSIYNATLVSNLDKPDCPIWQ